MRTMRTGLVIAAALAIATGCATGASSADPEARRSAGVEVINEVQPPTPVSVYLAEEVGGRSLPEARRSAGVEVINEVQPPTPVSVYLAEEVGGRSLLGTVEPMSRKTLPIRSLRPTASYRLEARTGGGRSIVSGFFTVGAGETVTWNLGTNVIGP